MLTALLLLLLCRRQKLEVAGNGQCLIVLLKFAQSSSSKLGDLTCFAALVLLW